VGAVDLSKPLNPKHEAFIREYLLSGNATEAYRKAGYKSKSPEVEASNLLRNPKVEARIKELQAKTQEIAEKKFNITEERILEQLEAIAFFDPMSVLEWDDKGRLIYKKDLKALAGANFTIYPEYQTAKDKSDGVLRAKLSFQSGDRRGALELLGKKIGLWSKANGTGPGADKGDRKAVLARVSALLRKRNGGGGSA
jgi:hypothetical protein